MQGVPASLAERLQELTYDERAVAYLQVDTALTLIDAGGHLDNYGLTAMRLGEPAVEQADEDGDPMRWVVSGVERSAAKVVSRLDGRPIFGGTPADAKPLRQAAHVRVDDDPLRIFILSAPVVNRLQQLFAQMLALKFRVNTHQRQYMHRLRRQARQH